MRGFLAASVLVLSACGAQLPAPECDPASEEKDAPLRCHDAVRQAVQVLPPDHPDVTRVQFVYASFQPWQCGAGPPPPEGPGRLCTHVVFTFADGSRQYVGVNLFGDQIAVSSPWP